MKKVIVGILLALVLSPAAFADGNGAGGLGVFGSWWDSQDYGALYGGGARLGFEIFSGVAVEARASYLVSEQLDDVVEGRSVSTELELVPLEAAVVWTLDVSEALKPYVGAGAGYYLKNVDWKADDVIDEADDKDSVGYFALAGLNVVLGNVVLFGEAKYHVVQNDDEWRWHGIERLGEPTLRKLMENSGVRHLGDLFELTAMDLLRLDGFAANVGLKLAF